MTHAGPGRTDSRGWQSGLRAVCVAAVLAIVAGLTLVSQRGVHVVVSGGHRPLSSSLPQISLDPAYAASVASDEVLGLTAEAVPDAAQRATAVPPTPRPAAATVPTPVSPTSVPQTLVPQTLGPASAVPPTPIPPLPLTPVPQTPGPSAVPPTPIPPSPQTPVSLTPEPVAAAVPTPEPPLPPAAIPAPTAIPAPPPPPTSVVVVPAPTVVSSQAPVPSATRPGPPGVINQMPGSVWQWLDNHGWRIDWRQGPGPGRISEAQYSTSTIVIWYDTSRSDTIWAGALAHELGHAVSYAHFGTQQMNDWNAMRGVSSWRWVPGTPNDFSVGEGDFAEAFMSYLLGHQVRSVGGPLTQQHRAWISANTPF